jgi:hypothetical protein
MKEVSFLMPTRSDHVWLFTALKSIVNKCSNVEDIEILLKIDEDDHARRGLIKEIERDYPARCVVSPRGEGYNHMGRFVKELTNVADSRWCWLFDDDAWIEGDGDYYSSLKELRCDPLHGPAANAEHYVLGQSYYPNGSSGGAPGIIMPTAFVKNMPPVLPVDECWLTEVHRMGWVVVQLPGVRYHHDGRPRV